MFHINIVLNTHRKVSMADVAFKTRWTVYLKISNDV